MSELFSVLDLLSADDVHSMAEPALLVRTEMLLTARNMLDAEIARSLQAADVREVMVAECGRTTRSWLVEEQYLSPDDAGRRMGVARALPFHPRLADAFRTGDVGHDHARVIVGCLRRLPMPLREVAETELTEAARHADPTSLSRACRDLRLRLGADEDAEAAAQRMYESRWATASATFEGMLHVEAMLDPEAGATLSAALAPLMHQAGEIDERSTAQRRADALVELAQFSLTHAGLPDHNGERPQIVVTIPWAELRDGLTAGDPGQATIDGSTPITPQTARMLACDAEILPAVLGGDSEVLDLGRARRHWSPAQRRARRIADAGCVFPKCQAGLDRCRLHHLEYWANGGSTDASNGAHVCRFHHWLVHHTRWTITRNRQGQIEVSRR
jgi:hypothetical protein